MTIRLTRIAWLLAASTLLTAIVGVVATYWVAREEFRDVLDRDLKTQSRLLLGLLDGGHLSGSGNEMNEMLARVFRDKDEETLWVNIYNTVDGQHYSNFEHDAELSDSDNHSIHLQLAGHDWWGEQRNDGPWVVQLMRRDDWLAEAQEEILEDIATPMLLVGSINLLLLAALIAMTLWPLSRLSRQLEMRSAHSLAPLVVRSPARELAVFRDSLNRLMSEVEEVLDRERQFANDVAHELRTPLTTLKLELANDDPDLGALKSEVNRLAQLVTQMLTLARVEQGHWRQSFEPVGLDGMVAAELEKMALAIDMAGMTACTKLMPVTVAGDRVLLTVLIGNLVNNVLRHCVPGTVISVTTEIRDKRAVLRVLDTGAGVNESQRARLNSAAGRLDSRGEGLGLGIAICRKIAEVHGASLHFMARDDGRSGLLVEIAFPA